MAGKRVATSELNHYNWDAEDQPEESGVFRTASKEELQRRVIRSGRRRAQPGGASQDKKSIFSAFSGFNKPAPTSFDFLSTLTNGAGDSTSNGSSMDKDSAPPTGLFGGSPLTTTTGTTNATPATDGSTKPGLFAINQTTTSETKPAFLFGQSSMYSTATSTPMFGAPIKTTAPTSNDTNLPTMFGIPTTKPPVSSDSSPTVMFGIPPKSTSPASTGASAAKMLFGIHSKTTPPPSSDSKPNTLFGIPSKTSSQSLGDSKPSFGIPPITSDSKGDSIFGIPQKSSTPMPAMKIPQLSTSTSSTLFNTGAMSSTPPSTKRTKSDDDNKVSKSSTNNKTQYYSKLKGLNESVSEWIKKHVNENPLCMLTPIFRDYERYLKELEEEHGPLNDEEPVKDKKNITEEKKDSSAITSSVATTSLSTVFGIAAASTSTQAPAKSDTGHILASTTPTSTPFSFGSTVTPPSDVAKSAPAPFSFGMGNTFSFNSNIQKPPEQNEKKEDEDEPPKVEFTPVAEENSVFEKRCKIFSKKDNIFLDKGVGTLYIKTIENSSKHQLIVRANTSLSTILLNFILSESIPTQRMGKNNVMVVCIPTPDAKPPPVPFLIRVKTSEEADELLETLNKYKK